MEPAQVVEKIRERFPEEFINTEEFRNQTSVTVRKDRVLDIFRFLHDEPDLSFDLLKDLTAVDYLGSRDVRFEVVYHLYSIYNGNLLRLKVPVSESDCSIDSAMPVWIGANWHERECFDMYGIRFNGHPDLRRILLPEDWEGYPLRKDYPAKGPQEEWSGFKEVLEKAEEFRKFQWNNK